MNRDGFRTFCSVVVLVLVLAALRKVFLDWNGTIPQPAPASDRSLVHPTLLGEENTGVYHDSRCKVIMDWRLPGVPVPREGVGRLRTFPDADSAFDAGYKPCPYCQGGSR